MIDDARIAMIGPLRQELLSGIKTNSQFNELKKRLEPFRDIPNKTEDYILVANFFTDAGRKVYRAMFDCESASVSDRNNRVVAVK